MSQPQEGQKNANERRNDAFFWVREMALNTEAIHFCPGNGDSIAATPALIFNYGAVLRLSGGTSRRFKELNSPICDGVSFVVHASLVNVLCGLCENNDVIALSPVKCCSYEYRFR